MSQSKFKLFYGLYITTMVGIVMLLICAGVMLFFVGMAWGMSAWYAYLGYIAAWYVYCKYGKKLEIYFNKEAEAILERTTARQTETV